MEYMTKDYKEKEFSGNLDMNIKLFKDIFKNDAILRNRTVNIGDTGYRASVFYMDGMVNSEILNESVIKPLVLAEINTDKVNAKNISSKIGAIMEIITKLNHMSELLISSWTGFAISVCIAPLRSIVIANPIRFPIHISVNVIDI